MCGYPEEYGEDMFLLTKMTEFLDDKNIRERLERLLAEIEKSKK